MLLENQNKQGFIVPITGGIDSAVCGALALAIEKSTSLSIYFVKMGFKPNEEKLFEGGLNKSMDFIMIRLYL